MAKRTGSTNEHMVELISDLKKVSVEKDAPIWKDVAQKLSKPTRSKVEVNLGEISRFAKDGDVIIVPGTVLASGNLEKNVSIAAWKFSGSAKGKIEKAKGKIVDIKQLTKDNPSGKGIRIMV